MLIQRTLFLTSLLVSFNLSYGAVDGFALLEATGLSTELVKTGINFAWRQGAWIYNIIKEKATISDPWFDIALLQIFANAIPWLYAQYEHFFNAPPSVIKIAAEEGT